MENEDYQKIFEKFERENAFSVMPEAVSEILYSLGSDKSSLGDVAGIIKRDPGLAIHIIQYVNSGAYKLTSPVSTVEQSVMIIGLRSLKGLCLSLPVFTQYKHVLGVPELWLHSRASAICCQVVASAIKFPEVDIAETAGLLHDIGKVVLAVSSPHTFKSNVQTADLSDREVDWRQEKRLLGFNHCFVGSSFARKYNFPIILVESIMWHHEFEKSSYRDMACLTFVGEQLAVATGKSHPDYIFLEPSFVRALDHLRIDHDLLEKIVTECLGRVGKMSGYD